MSLQFGVNGQKRKTYKYFYSKKFNLKESKTSIFMCYDVSSINLATMQTLMKYYICTHKAKEIY